MESSVEITRNPSRSDVAKVLRRHGTARVLRDPATGSVYVWGSDLGRHVDAAHYLDLAFRNRRQLQENSFVIDSMKDFEALRGVGALTCKETAPPSQQE
jgi:hypothetical protein